MEWIANISIEWVIVISLALAAVRLSLAKAPALPKAISVQVGEFLEALLFAVVLVFLIIRPFIVQAFYIPSESMMPTLLKNDRILVNKFIYRFSEPHRGDIIVFKAPPQASPEEKDFIKRVIGLPGDIVEVRGGVVYINNKPLKEDYILEPPMMDIPPVKVPPRHLYVLGDNRNNSRDSRYWGFLDRSRVLGKAWVIFWPPQRISLLR